MRKLAFLLTAIATLLLSGCSAAEEVQRRIVVHALGIDSHEKGYEVSYQVFSGGSSDGAPVDADESTVMTLLAQGQTLYETEESLRLQTGKDVFLGDAELIVISEELKDIDLTEFLNYFRLSDIYLGVNVVYCEGKAKDTIGAKLQQGSATAILLRGVVEQAIEKSRAQSARIIEIYTALERDNEAIAIPVLTLKKGDDKKQEQGGGSSGKSGEDGGSGGSSDKSGEGGSSSGDSKESKGDDSTISDTDIGVFSSMLILPDGEPQELSTDEVIGLRLLRADAKELTLETPVPQGTASVELINIKIKRSLTIKNSIPELRVKITGEYHIRSSPTDADEEEIRLAAQNQLIELCQSAVPTLQIADTIEIAKMLWKYQTKYAKTLNGDFTDVIPKTTVSVEARLQKY